MGRSDEIGLAEAEFFRAMSGDRLQRIRPHLTHRDFGRGRVLFFEGQPADHLWAIRSGEVRQYKSSPDGHVTTLDVLGPGEIFGALSALEQEFYPASAEGLSEGSVWCLKRSSFLRLVAEEPRLGVELLRVVSHRLNDARERMRSFAHDPAPRRLAQALLRVSRSGEAQVTRRDLAESAGTTVETAIRVMRGFERDRVIEGSVGRIRLLDESALRAIAGEEDG